MVNGAQVKRWLVMVVACLHSLLEPNESVIDIGSGHHHTV